jgi:hypothetical protein
MLIPLGVVLAVLLPSGIWAAAHPGLAVLAAIALIMAAVGVVKFCREIAPSLAVRSWPPSFARPPSPRWSAA